MEKIRFYCVKKNRICVIGNEYNSCMFCDIDLQVRKNLSDSKLTIGYRLNKKNTVLFSSEGNLFAISQNSIFYGTFKIEKLVSCELLKNNETVTKVTNGFVPALVGGAMLGPVGAIAGSMISGSTKKTKNNANYSLKIQINDMNFPGTVIECDNYDVAFKVLSTFNMMLETLSKKN